MKPSSLDGCLLLCSYYRVADDHTQDGFLLSLLRPLCKPLSLDACMVTDLCYVAGTRLI